eukprot:4010207-Alexandrium_andersonii.AAC.1
MRGVLRASRSVCSSAASSFRRGSGAVCDGMVPVCEKRGVFCSSGCKSAPRFSHAGTIPSHTVPEPLRKLPAAEEHTERLARGVLRIPWNLGSGNYKDLKGRTTKF